MRFGPGFPRRAADDLERETHEAYASHARDRVVCAKKSPVGWYCSRDGHGDGDHVAIGPERDDGGRLRVLDRWPAESPAARVATAIDDAPTPREIGLRSALDLERLAHAETARAVWFERYNHAATQLDRWDREIAARRAISRGEVPT